MATVRYLVEDVDRAIATYTSIFGFELTKQWGSTIGLLQRGDLELWLSGPASSAARAMTDGAAPVPGGWNRFVLKVSDIDAELLKITGSGIEPRNAVVRGPGGAQVLIPDGEGNLVELFQPAP